MRVRFGFLALLLFPALALPGQAIPDSLFRADQRMLDTAKTMSQDSAFQFLAPYLAQRYRSGNWTQSLAEGYHKIASDLQRIGNNLTGLSYVDTALTIRPTLPDTKHLQFARSYFVKGALLTQLNAYHLATEWSERAVAELNTGFAAGEQHADLEIMLGYFHQHSGRVALLNYDFDLAERRLAQAETILETYPDDWTAFDVLVDRGNMNVRKENFPTAITAYEEVFRLAAASEDQLYVRIALFNLALSHSQLGNRTEANRLFDELRGDFREIPPQERDLQYYSFLGNFYGESLKHQLRTGRFRDTEALLQDGLEAFRYEFPTGLGGARGELLTAAAQVADQKGNAVRADSLLRAAFASLVDGYNPSGQKFLPILADRTIYGQRELLFALATARDLSREESTEAGLLDAMAASYTIDTLLQRFREQFNLTGSFGHFLRQQRHHYVTAVDIALQLYRRTGKPEYLTTAYGFVATEKGNLLRRYLTSPGLARSFGVPDDLLQRQRNLELTILALESAVVNKEETITLRDSLLRLNTELQLLKTDLKTNYPAFTRALQGYAPIDPINIQRQLADNQQLIEFFLTPDSVYAFTLTSATGLGVRVLPRPRDLEALISGTVRGSPEAASGYDQLLADILEPGLRRVQLIPDGELWALPFQALRLPDGRFLIEEYAISYAYASSLLFDETQRKTAVAELENFRGFGIDYTDLVGRLTASGNRSAVQLRNLGPLPFASQEVRQAADKTGGRSLLNEDVTKRRFLAEADGADIIHLAMHGILAKDPLRSSLVFNAEEDSTYALLTMGEVLAGQFPAELAVLSACHTGQGAIETAEGVLSMGRAFTAAGTRSTVTSTWAANDQTTYDILTVFYDHLSEGAARDVALQRAIVHYLREGTAADRQPVNWANLTLVGALDPIRKPFLAKWWPYLLGVVLLLGVGWLLGLFPAPAAAPNSERSDYAQRK